MPERNCPCSAGVVEIIKHVKFPWWFYQEIVLAEVILPQIRRLLGHSDPEIARKLFIGLHLQTTAFCTRLFVATGRIWKDISSSDLSLNTIYLNT